MTRSSFIRGMALLLSLTALGNLSLSRIARARDLASEEREQRLNHAHELLGKYYSHSVVRTGEQVQRINGQIYKWTRESLPKKYRRKYRKVAKAIIDEAHKYDFDPVFVMSVIMKESSFIPNRKGGVGEIGLMQIRPETGKWIAHRFHMRWRGKKSLYNPVTNIRLGTAYLSYLREELDDHARLYLAAYNMGLYNVRDAVDRDVWPKEYPARIMEQYVAYYTELRKQVELDAVLAEQLQLD